LSGGDMPVSGHNQTVPFEERLFREGGGETVADREHQRGGALGALVPGGMAGLYSQILPDRRHDIFPAQQFSFDRGGLDRFDHHHFDGRLQLRVGSQPLEESAGPTGFFGKLEQRLLDTREVVSKLRPVWLLPIVGHEPDDTRIRLIM